MPDDPQLQGSSEPRTRVRGLQADLQDVAARLREARFLEPEAQRALADLVEELMTLLHKEDLPAAELDHLADMTGHLREALHHDQDVGAVGRVREGFQRALSNAQTSAPLAMGLARQLLDTLANIGI